MKRFIAGTALATGGGRGIAAAIVHRLARAGTRVAISFASDSTAVEALPADMGSGAIALPADVSSLAGIESSGGMAI